MAKDNPLTPDEVNEALQGDSIQKKVELMLRLGATQMEWSVGTDKRKLLTITAKLNVPVKRKKKS